jgi:hypothetical protein
VSGAGEAISVICATRHPGPVVASAMVDLRSAVDEIIIAADARVGEDDLDCYATVADRVLRFEFSGPNRAHGWLADQARGDWLLLLDGDELAGSALIGALPELAADRRIGQYLLPKRWSWPDPSSYLADEPWSGDVDSRLFRNDGRTLLPGRPHHAIVSSPPLRVVEEAPIYHLDLLLSEERARRAKAERYDRLRFGPLTASGRPVNQARYLPEERPSAATQPVDEADRLRIERVLAGDPPAGPRIASEPIRLYSAAEVESHWAGRTPASGAYRAEVELVGELPRFAAGGGGHRVWVRVRNTGTEVWPGGREHPPLIRVGARWRSCEREPERGGRGFLPHPLQPGEETIVPLAITGPALAGPAELVVDLVHERVRWFEMPATARVEVMSSAADSLAELDRRHGPLVPLDEVMKLRSELGRRNALVPPASGDDQRSLEAAAIDGLADAVAEAGPEAVAEFGGGTSTLALARLLAEMHGAAEVRLLSFDEDEALARTTRAALAREGLADAAEVVVLPLGAMPRMPFCYQLTPAASALLRERPPELVLVGGPSPDSGASPLGVLELVAPFAPQGALVLLACALRDAELRVGQAWAERADTEVLGIRVAGMGILEARIRAEAG